ncbi:MAG: IclR family transcriptional regulator [Halarsenatibacteraceae bacterium]
MKSFNLENKSRSYRNGSSNEKITPYLPGRNLVDITGIIKKNNDLISKAREEMDKLVKLSNEAVYLHLLENEQLVTVDKYESKNYVKLSCETGLPFPLYATAPGKVVLAYIDESNLDNYLEEKLTAYTEHTIIDKEELKSELKEVKENGCAISFGELEVGVLSISVPIFENGEIRGAISIAGPEYRVYQQQGEYLIALLKAANRINKMLNK